MYRGFNVRLGTLSEENFLKGNPQFETNKRQVKTDLQKFITLTGNLDGSMMEKEWFPNVKADIFISHSHDDEKEAIKLAGWIKDSFNLDCFIDSCVWESGDDLIKMIDNEYCRSEGDITYNYKRRNLSTSHVHMMLSTALAKMIDRAECLFFLNTPNSVSTSEIISKTVSPWIYSEIAISQLVRKPLKFHRDRELVKSFSESRKFAIPIVYDLGLKGFSGLDSEDLRNWHRKWKNGSIPKGNSLDYLYDLHISDGSNILNS
jgi:hypothetical protein